MEGGNEFEKMTVEDLIANDRFLRWVKHPDEELDAYWAAQFAKHPEAEQEAEEARRLILETTFKETLPPVGRREALFERIKEEAGIETPSQSNVRPMRRWLQVAASLSLMALVGAWLYTRYTSKSTGGSGGSPQFAVENKEGLLYLNDGRVISLADLAVGAAIGDEGGELELAEANHLTYRKGNGAEVLLVDSILSPVGQVFQVDLPDGSRMWLNSGTMVRMATAFADDSRKVSVAGQAYFDVARDETTPFTVMFDQGQLTVLGTQFDVMTYPGIPSTVTLLEGSVRVADNHDFQETLHPGEQVVYPGDGEPTVSEVDTTLVVAWKNGVFAFQDAPVDQVMEQLARWYGTTVEYEGARPATLISGTIPVDLSTDDLSAVLNDIGSDASFRITADKIIVSTKK